MSNDWIYDIIDYFEEKTKVSLEKDHREYLRELFLDVYDDGVFRGRDAGDADGYLQGFDDGAEQGWDNGEAAGYDDGYQEGYMQGFAEAEQVYHDKE